MELKLLQAKAAVLSLSRVRAVERPPGSDGLKSVWHQGAKGADLHSYVDLGGHVTRQEFTLIDDYFLWTSKYGVQTGFVEEDSGLSAKGAATVGMDWEQRLDRLERASQALKTYSGDDRYIRALALVSGLACSGSKDLEERSVTHAYKSGEFELPSHRVPWGLLLITAAAFAAVGALVAFAFNRG